MKSNSPFLNLLAVQFKEFTREPEALFWALIFPILLSWALGLAFSQKAEPVRTIAVVKEGTALSENLLNLEQWAVWLPAVGKEKKSESPKAGCSAFQNFRFYYTSLPEVVRTLQKGKIDLYLTTDPKGDLIFNYDPNNGEARATALLLDRSLRTCRGDKPAGQEQILTIPGTRYIDFLIPGLLALNIMSACLWGVGWGLIELRMKKLLKRMAASPMNKNMYLLSLFTARLLFSIGELILLFGFALLYFHMHVTGSLFAFLLVLLAGNTAFFFISVLLGSRTASSRVGNGLINAVSLPMMLLSGIFFSYQHFPEVLIPLVRVLPLTLLADSLRAIVNEGAGLAEVWPAVLGLFACGIFFFILSRRFFKWT
jgi:ABC-type multidrug transport system permease subunit